MTIPSNLIRTGTEDFSAVLENGDGEHARYDYGVSATIPDTHYSWRGYDDDGMLVRGLLPRMTEDEADEWRSENAWLIRQTNNAASNVTYWKARYEETQTAYSETYDRYTAHETALNSLLSLIGDKAREYATENQLCENYERFVSLVVEREARRISNERLLDYYGSNVHDEDSNVGKAYRSAAELLVRHMTRVRGVTVNVGATHNGYAIDANRLTVGEARTYYGQPEHTTTIRAESLLSFENACKANAYGIRNGWQNGHRAFEQEEEDTTHEGQTYCTECDAWHENE